HQGVLVATLRAGQEEPGLGRDRARLSGLARRQAAPRRAALLRRGRHQGAGRALLTQASAATKIAAQPRMNNEPPAGTAMTGSGGKPAASNPRPPQNNNIPP